MKRQEKRQLEAALSEHYRQERDNHAPEAGYVESTAMAAATAAREGSARGAGIAVFISAAVRHCPRAFWLAPVFVIVLAVAAAFADASPAEVQQAMFVSGPVLAATCLLGAFRSMSCQMQEIEAACMHNAFSVACARLIVLSACALLGLAIACDVVSEIVPAISAAAYALAPFLVSAAAGLALVRRAASVNAAVSIAISSTVVAALCIVLRGAAPQVYDAALLWVWFAAAAAAALWCVKEGSSWGRLLAQGYCPPQKQAYFNAL